MSGEITLVFYVALVSIAGLGICLQLKHYSLPVHADSGEFIYRGVLEREGEKFRVMEINMPWKELLTLWRHWSMDNFLKGYPPIQNKILVYQVMTWFFRKREFKVKDFRFLSCLYHGCTILMMGVLGMICGGAYAGLGTALLYAVFSASPFADTAQIHAEHYAALPVAAACACLLVGWQPGGGPWLVAAGFLLALTTLLLKLTYGVEFIFFGILSLGVGGLAGLGHYLLGMVSFLILLALVYGGRGQGKQLYFWLILTILWIKKYHAGSQALRSEVSVTGPGNRNARPSLWPRISCQEKYRTLLRQISPLLVGAVLFVIDLMISGLPLTKSLVIVWGAAAIVAVMVQNKYYLAHIVPLLGPATLMCGMVVPITLLSHFTTYKILAIFIICCSFCYSWPAWRPYFSCPDALQYHCQFYKTLGNLNTLRALAVEPIAQYLRERTAKQDRILQWGGTHQELYALAGRRAALDTLENHLLLSPEINDAYLGVDWRSRLVQDVAAMNPAYIADLEGSLNIEALSQATGLRFELDKVFYQMFPVYHCVGSSGPRRPLAEPAALTSPSLEGVAQGKPLPLKDFNDLMGRWFNQGLHAEADTLTQGGVTSLLQDWQSLNASGSWRRSCPRVFGEFRG